MQPNANRIYIYISYRVSFFNSIIRENVNLDAYMC